MAFGVQCKNFHNAGAFNIRVRGKSYGTLSNRDVMAKCTVCQARSQCSLMTGSQGWLGYLETELLRSMRSTNNWWQSSWATERVGSKRKLGNRINVSC